MLPQFALAFAVELSFLSALLQAPGAPSATKPDANPPAAPEKVDVEPVAQDEQIGRRLLRIMKATTWFDDPTVRVDQGVVILGGHTDNKDHKAWAGELASKTEDVVAVVNHIQLDEAPLFDMRPAVTEIESLLKGGIRLSPLFGVAAIVLLLSWFAAKLTQRLTLRVLERRLGNALLAEVGSKAVAIPVFLLGLYLVLELSGLARVALTVAGGTGLAGLVLGIAFRDILENFLAGILISVQHPFRVGDLIRVEDKQGFVQRVTTRGTILIAYDGTYIQVPNSTIYKTTIHNFTANPKMRQEFVVNLGLLDPIETAQDLAAKVLREHSAILKDPEPVVLVDELTGGSINLKAYFWVDATEYSDLKVRSSAIRLVKDALQKAKMLSPDGIQQIAFPKGLAIRRDEADGDHKPAEQATADGRCTTATCPPQDAAARAEGDLGSEAAQLRAQAKAAPLPEQGANLIAHASSGNGRPA